MELKDNFVYNLPRPILVYDTRRKELEVQTGSFITKIEQIKDEAMMEIMSKAFLINDRGEIRDNVRMYDFVSYLDQPIKRDNSYFLWAVRDYMEQLDSTLYHAIDKITEEIIWYGGSVASAQNDEGTLDKIYKVIITIDEITKDGKKSYDIYTVYSDQVPCNCKSHIADPEKIAYLIKHELEIAALTIQAYPRNKMKLGIEIDSTTDDIDGNEVFNHLKSFNSDNSIIEYMNYDI